MEITSPSFKDNARNAMADADLQRALGNVEKGFIEKRSKAVAKLPEFDDLRDSGLTIVVITHDDEVARHARRIVRMVDGTLHEVTR